MPFLSSGKCVARCALGSYGALGRCEPCAVGCTACYAADQCTACGSDLILLDGKCLTSPKRAGNPEEELVTLSADAKLKVPPPEAAYFILYTSHFILYALYFLLYADAKSKVPPPALNLPLRMGGRVLTALG